MLHFGHMMTNLTSKTEISAPNSDEMAYTSQPAANTSSTSLSEEVWRLRPTDYATVHAPQRSRKIGQGAAKISTGEVGSQGRP